MIKPNGWEKGGEQKRGGRNSRLNQDELWVLAQKDEIKQNGGIMEEAIA